ncbi:MAG: ABC transporter permease [Candidatus Limnocylindrales bacterium]|jgi:ABC-2 type transport system permease protein
MRRVIVMAVVRREVLEIMRNRLLVLSIVIPPVVLVLTPLLLGGLAGLAASVEPLPPEFIARVIATRPDWAGFSVAELVSAYSLQQFLALFLILPAYVPLSIATFSIVGEKQARSLEAVLAAPIKTSELLGGKTLSAIVPGMATSWLAYAVLVILAGTVIGPRLAGVLLDPSWLAGVFLLGPAVGLVSCVAGIIVSSRVNDPRVAQQIGGLIIIPLASIAVIQALGGFLFGAPQYVLAAIVTTIVGIAGLRVAARLFGRETILTRWR